MSDASSAQNRKDRESDNLQYLEWAMTGGK